MKWLTLIVCVTVLALVAYLGYYHPASALQLAWYAVFFAFAVPVLVIAALTIARIKGTKKKGSETQPSEKPSSQTAQSPKPAPAQAPQKGAKSSGWVGKGLYVLLLVFAAILAIWFCTWFFTGGANQMAEWSLNKTASVLFEPSNASRKQTTVSKTVTTGIVVATVPKAGILPICAQNSARVLTLTSNEWTSWQRVPAGCVAQVDVTPDPNKYRLQCRDLEGNENAVCTTYTAIRFQNAASCECHTMALQLWFVPVKV